MTNIEQILELNSQIRPETDYYFKMELLDRMRILIDKELRTQDGNKEDINNKG